MKSFKEHAREIRESSKSEPSPEAVAKMKKVFLVMGIIVTVVCLILWAALSC